MPMSVKLKVKLFMVGSFNDLKQTEQMFATLKELSHASKFNLEVTKVEP